MWIAGNYSREAQRQFAHEAQRCQNRGDDTVAEKLSTDAHKARGIETGERKQISPKYER